MSFKIRIYDISSIQSYAKSSSFYEFKEYFSKIDSLIFRDEVSYKTYNQFNDGDEETKKEIYRSFQKIKNDDRIL